MCCSNSQCTFTDTDLLLAVNNILATSSQVLQRHRNIHGVQSLISYSTTVYNSWVVKAGEEPFLSDLCYMCRLITGFWDVTSKETSVNLYLWVCGSDGHNSPYHYNLEIYLSVASFEGIGHSHAPRTWVLLHCSTNAFNKSTQSFQYSTKVLRTCTRTWRCDRSTINIWVE